MLLSVCSFNGSGKYKQLVKIFLLVLFSSAHLCPCLSEQDIKCSVMHHSLVESLFFPNSNDIQYIFGLVLDNMSKKYQSQGSYHTTNVR